MSGRLRLCRFPRPALSRAALVAFLALSVALPPGAAGASTAPPPTPEAAAPPPAAPLAASQFAKRLSKEVYAFLPYWEIDETTDGYIRYDLLTDIALFSVGVTSNGSLATSATGYATVTGSRARQIIANAHAAGVRVDMTFTSFGFAKNAAFFTNADAQAKAISSLVGLVDQLGLDGVNVDVEQLENQYFAAYGAFVGRLRDALRKTNPAARVSVSTNANVSGGNMAVQALANGADRVFIMGYSFRNASSTEPGPVDPLVQADGGGSLTTAAKIYADKQVPADRILLGLAYYGYTWPTASGERGAPATGKGTLFFPGPDRGSIPSGTTIRYDDVEHAAWFAVQDPTTKAWSQTWFPNERSLRAKYAFAADRGYAGVGLWVLGYDQGASGYWQAIASSFGAVRIGGADRFETAALVSRQFGTPGGTVYVATGLAFPDALAAVAAAGRTGSPVLLVTRTAVPRATADELARLKPRRIVVLGSAGAVSDAVLSALAPYASEGVSRIGGADRYDTAARVSKATFPDGAPVAYVVTGRDFPDALSAGPVAVRDGGPVLLTDPAVLSAPTAAELVRLEPGRVVIVGSPGAVSEAVASAIRSTLPGATVERIGGADRFETSALLSATFAPDREAVFVATGLDFPDALAGAAAAAHLGVPVLVTRPDVVPSVVSGELVRLAPRRAVILGSSAVVGTSVLVSVRTAVAAP